MPLPSEPEPRGRRRRPRPEPSGCGWSRALLGIALLGTLLLLAISSYQADGLALKSYFGTVSAASFLSPGETSSTEALTSSTAPRTAALTTVAPASSTVPLGVATTAAQGAVMQVTDGSGRLGNNLAFILRGVLYAKLTGHTQVHLNMGSKSVKELLEPKAVLELSGLEMPGERFCPPRSDKRQEGRAIYNYQGERCKGSAAKDFHLLALQTLAQAFRPDFKTCLETVAPNAAQELTVHLRGQDLWGMAEYELTSEKPIPMEANAHHWLWHQPPCTMYRKIIAEEGFKKVIVVTSPDLRHVCVQWLQSNAASLGVEVLIQAGSLREDFCALARATNLVLSFSTLGDNAAVLNKQLKNIYFREFAQTHSLMDCGLWPGTSLWQYRMQISEGKHPPYGNSYREIIKWFTSYDDSQITKVPGCR